MDAALWFGPDGRQLFGRFWVPEGGLARGAVVLCPPVGVEAHAAARAYKELGKRLSHAGLATVQVDYLGTGDSAGAEAGSGPQEWARSVSVAVDHVRSAGASNISLVGMRLGAALAASVANGCRVDQLVLWDPCDGRSYLREQALLYRVYAEGEHVEVNNERPDGSFETLGYVYDRPTTEAIRALDLVKLPGPWAPHVLALLRSEIPPRASLLDKLAEERVEREEAPNQEQLLSVWPLMSVVPEATLKTVTDWLGSHAPGQPDRFCSQAQPKISVQAIGDDHLVEEVLSVGPNKLFGVLTRPASGVTAPVMVLLNAGLLDHSGPAGLWAQLARRWASLGMTTARVDLSGIGDSPPSTGAPADEPYPLQAMKDLSEILQSVSPDGPPGALLIGLCTGAYHALEAATALPVKGVVLINPVLSKPQGTPPAQGPSGHLRQSRAPGHPLAQLQALRNRAIKWVKHVPGHRRAVKAIWRMLDVKWWWHNRISGRPREMVMLGQLAQRGRDILVVLGEYEARLVSRGEAATLRRARRSGHFRFEALSEIDHTFYLQGSRDKLVPLVTKHIVSLRQVAQDSPSTGEEPASKLRPNGAKPTRQTWAQPRAGHRQRRTAQLPPSTTTRYGAGPDREV